MIDQFVWVEKYRPKRLSDVILPEKIKEKLQKLLDSNDIPNLIFSGSSGCGKTTVAKAMLEELGCDYMMINGSMERNIDTLRVKIKEFASSVSLSGGRKYVIIDEADYLNLHSTQPALRNFMEEYSRNCGFILTCNYVNRILEPLRSRCSSIDFAIPKDEKQDIIVQFFKSAKSILDQENVKYEQKTLAMVLEKHFPDFRKTLNELQYHSSTGELKADSVRSYTENYKKLFGLLKTKNFTEMRQWVTENNDIHAETLFDTIFSLSDEYIESSSVPQLVLILADYQYKQAFVSNVEINIVACLTEIMAGVVFK